MSSQLPLSTQAASGALVLYSSSGEEVVQAPHLCEARDGTDKVLVSLRGGETRMMVRSTRFWFQDGNMVFSAGTTLYKLYGGLLGNHSPIFADMYSLPPVPNSYEGASESTPVHLELVEPLDFEALIELLCGSVLQPGERAVLFIPTVRQLIGILGLATRWDMPRPREYAIDKLGSIPLSGNKDWGPIAKAACSMRFGVAAWLVPSLKAVLALEPREWGTLHFELFRTTLASNEVNMLWRRIDRHRKALAWSPPTFIAGYSCPSATQCSARWTATWHQALGPRLVHPDTPVSDEALLQIVRESQRESGLCYLCHLRVTQAMVDSGDWTKEARIIESVAQSIRESSRDTFYRDA